MRVKDGSDLRSLIDGALAAAGKASGAVPGSRNGNQTFSSPGSLGPAATITFTSASPYTPFTTGFALLMASAQVTTSNAGDSGFVAPQVNSVSQGLGGPCVAGANGTTALGVAYAVVAITKNVPFTPGVQAGNNSGGGHTFASTPGNMAISVIELQTH